jgi:hypothetical protein
MIHIGAKIPNDMAISIEALAPYVRGGKSQVIRNALAIGLEQLRKNPTRIPQRNKPTQKRK